MSLMFPEILLENESTDGRIVYNFRLNNSGAYFRYISFKLMFKCSDN